MTVNLSLCSGAGTLDLAVEHITGGKTLVYAESDPHASRVMATRFPWATNIGDITTADWTGIAQQHPVDTITAGFPCKDISNAGPRVGIRGRRSGIWRNVAEAVRIIRPRIVFLENVEAIRSRGLHVVVEDLAAIGYGLWWTGLPASAVGAASIRWRWFGIARPDGTDPDVAGWRQHWTTLPAARVFNDELATLPLVASRDWKSAASNKLDDNSRPLNEYVANRLAAPGVSWVTDHGVDHTPAIRRWETVLGRPAPTPWVRGPRGGRQLSPRFAEWMQGNDDGWITDVDIPWTKQIEIAGNQAITRQAIEGYRRLLCADLDAMAAA
ncbi:DNA cytosine methyltransferase [Streptomyces sp. NPDC046866]|uniref:DNA cytosine methyltransferase n=1 Tax=Streptomyces sp. NPDC046866 TaxID=3154921 RepID=UPI003456011A